MANKVYIMENLGCAHCAGKIEAEVRKLPQVQEAVMVFETKQLRVKTEQPEGLEQTIETIAQSYEPDVTVHDRDGGKSGGHHHHDHDADCCCGHDHEHEHHHHHDHDADCCCGHDHEHEHHHHHDHDADCCCGHDHHHEHEEHEHHHHHEEQEPPLQRSATTGGTTKIYRLENLDCANCGAKIESRINAMDGVSDAVLTFATMQLRVKK